MESVSQSVSQSASQPERHTELFLVISKPDGTVVTARRVSRLTTASAANILRSDQNWRITLEIRTDINVSKINQNQIRSTTCPNNFPILHFMKFSFAFPGVPANLRGDPQISHSTGMPKSSYRFFKHQDG